MKEIWSVIKCVLSEVWSLVSTEPTSTIVAGVIVFVACEWFRDTWLSPLQEYKKLKAKTSQLLIKHAQYYANPVVASNTVDEYSRASEEIRNLAAEWAAFSELIPPMHIGIPNPKAISQVSKKLVGLSNSFYASSEKCISVTAKTNQNRIDEIKSNLKLRGVKD